MNKSEFVEEIAKATGFTKTDAGKAVDAMVDTITAALKKKDSVSLVGFGTFTVKRREARTGRNPRTGEAIKIAASNIPTFKAGKSLKDSVN